MYDINVRLVYGMRTIGKGQVAANTLCGVLNLPKPPTKFGEYIKVLGSAAEDVCFGTMREAVEEAVVQNEDKRDLCVAIDGTWQKRGHTSQNGVITATSVDTGKVIDAVVLSKHCRCKGKFTGQHNDQCSANYQGVSGGMEVVGARTIFQRSMPTYGVRYTQYLGDGDSKGFSSVAESMPYGNDCPVTKLECIGHVQKRMGSRLRTLKIKEGKRKLEDGKTLGGRNRLTDVAILSIQKYYGLAIRRNTNSLKDMKQAVWAEYYHLLSTNTDPQHFLCPKGNDSWCKYQKAEALQEQYDHEKHFHLPIAVMEKIKPIFKDLSAPDLLKKCLHGKTQNPNESVNQIIWNRLPKTVFVSIHTLHFGVYDAINSFNKGHITRCMIFKKLGMIVGQNFCDAMKDLDVNRLNRAQRMVSDAAKRTRQARLSAKRKLEDEWEDLEDPDDPSYGAGCH